MIAHTQHPVLGPLARQRTLHKLLSVYGHGYLKHRHPVTQRVHPHYRLLGTVAGRFGCSNPNIQQLPSSAELRQLVRADPGRLLVCADYSQIELRIAALLSRDALLLAAYSAGADLHAQTAEALCGDATRRQLGKCANFGLLYGSGAAGLQAFAKSSYHVVLTLPKRLSTAPASCGPMLACAAGSSGSTPRPGFQKRCTPEPGWCVCWTRTG